MADAFLTSLLNGDILGFVTSMYTSVMGQGFYAFVLAIVFGAFYNRGGTLPCIVLWLLLGGVWIVAAAEASPIAVGLLVLGIVGVIFKLYTLMRST